jgi:hypothetical protein
MSGPPPKRRRTKAIGPGSIEFTKAFTHKTITTTNRSGIIVTKDVLVPLVPTTSKQHENNTSASTSSLLPNDYDINMEDPLINEIHENSNKSKVCIKNMGFHYETWKLIKFRIKKIT